MRKGVGGVGVGIVMGMGMGMETSERLGAIFN